jgi:hypothetical protein
MVCFLGAESEQPEDALDCKRDSEKNRIKFYTGFVPGISIIFLPAARAPFCIFALTPGGIVFYKVVKQM